MKTSMNLYTRKSISGPTDGCPHLPFSLQTVLSEGNCKEKGLLYYNTLIINKLKRKRNKFVTQM